MLLFNKLIAKRITLLQMNVMINRVMIINTNVYQTLSSYLFLHHISIEKLFRKQSVWTINLIMLLISTFKYKVGYFNCFLSNITKYRPPLYFDVNIEKVQLLSLFM